MMNPDGGDPIPVRLAAALSLFLAAILVAVSVWMAVWSAPAATAPEEMGALEALAQPQPAHPTSEEDPLMLSAEPDEAEITWHTMVEVAQGGGFQGPWRMNDSEWRYVDAPTVALDEEGGVAVAWVDQARKEVLFQRYGARGAARLEEPVNVSRSPEIFSWLPRLATPADDPTRIYVLWQEIVFSGGTHGGEIFFARSTDDGRTFSDPVNLSRTPAGAGKGRLTARLWHNGSLDLAAGPEGEVYAAWTEYEGALRIARSADGGESFSAPLTVAEGGDEAPARGPDLALAGDGTVHLAWTVGEDPEADIRLATSTDGAERFSGPRTIHRSGGHADAPKIAVDGAGTLHLVYAESPDGPLQRYHVRHARSHDGGETFEAPRRVPGEEAEGGEGAHFPELAVDEDDTVYLLWHLLPDPGERPRGLALATSRDGGESFSSPAAVPGTADPGLGITGSLQGLLVRKLAAGGSGTVAVVNGTFRQGDESRIRLMMGEGM